MKLSVVIPIYNEESVISTFHASLIKNISTLNITYKVLYVLDAPTDNSVNVLENIIHKDKSTEAIVLARRVGHQLSLLAGIEYALDADCILMMDGDMQHPPELIGEFLKEYNNGFEIVYTIRNNVNKNYIYKVLTKVYYGLFSFFSESLSDINTPDFRLISNRVAKFVVQHSKERGLYLRGIIHSLGFKQKMIRFTAPERMIGTSKYTFKTSLKLAATGFVYAGFKPLIFMQYIGFSISFVSLILGLFFFINYFFDFTAPKGWHTIVIMLFLFGGLQILMLGIIGFYVRILIDDVRHNPKFLIDRVIKHEF